MRLCSSGRPLAITFGRVMIYGQGNPPMKLLDPLSRIVANIFVVTFFQLLTVSDYKINLLIERTIRVTMFLKNFLFLEETKPEVTNLITLIRGVSFRILTEVDFS